MLNPIEFSERLKQSIKDANLTQKELASKIGVSKTAINNYANGRIPDASVLYELSLVLGKSMEWLLSGNGPTNQIGNTSNLSKQEIYLIKLYRRLNPRDQVKIEAIIEEKLDEPLGNKTEEKLLNSQTGERDKNVG